MFIKVAVFGSQDFALHNQRNIAQWDRCAIGIGHASDLRLAICIGNNRGLRRRKLIGRRDFDQRIQDQKGQQEHAKTHADER